MFVLEALRHIFFQYPKLKFNLKQVLNKKIFPYLLFLTIFDFINTQVYYKIAANVHLNL